MDFWTYSCVNCVRTIPYLRAWYERYKDQGLVIVGVHSPEFAFERSEANVRRASAELKVTWPVVQDKRLRHLETPTRTSTGRRTTSTTAQESSSRPTSVRATTPKPRRAIAAALGTKVAAAAVADEVPIAEGPKTPETYLGYGRGQRFSSPEDVKADAPATYSVPPGLTADHWAFSGSWTVGKEASQAQKGSALTLNYQGARVYWS